MPAEELVAAERLSYARDVADIADCNVYIVTVPTPIDDYKRPDLTMLEGASRTVGPLLQAGDVVTLFVQLELETELSRIFSAGQGSSTAGS